MQVERFGIKDTKKWIEAFLCDKKQKVSNSRNQWCSSGVSPKTNTFFTMFMNDIPGGMDNLTIFAVDTKQYAALTDDVNSPISLQEDIAKLQGWSTTMHMKFHPDKCHVLHLKP